MRHEGSLCAGANQRGKSIVYNTFNMIEFCPISAKSIPSKISMVRYLEAQTHTPTRTDDDSLMHTDTLAQMHTRSRARAPEGHSHMRWRVQQHRRDESIGDQRQKYQSDDRRPAANAKQRRAPL